MFFVASKLLAILIDPLLWLIAILLWAWRTRNPRRRKRLLWCSAIGGVVLTSPLLVNLAHRAWERPPRQIATIEVPYDYAIVLGGFSSPGMEPRDRLHFNASANRLTHALELYHGGKVRKLLIAGGSAAIVGEKTGEAGAVETFLRRTGFPGEDLLIENDSRNTYENARNTAGLLGDSSPRCLLLTDGFHMRRALACYRKAGLPADPFPTSNLGRSVDFANPRNYLIPNGDKIDDWRRLIKEIAGFVVYKVCGFA